MNFDVIFLRDAIAFLNGISEKARKKILYNIDKARRTNDVKVFKKLSGTDIWEFRCEYEGMQYRLLAFWVAETRRMVVSTHGFIKKDQKTPKKEIERAIEIKNKYLKK